MSVLDNEMHEESIGIALARIEGKLDLIQQAQDTTNKNVQGVRERVHQVSNEVQKLMALNLPETKDKVKDVEARVLVLEKESERRTGALGLAKILYGGFGAIVGVIGAYLMKTFGH